MGKGSVAARRFVVVHNPEEATRDAARREEAITELKRRLLELGDLTGKEHSRVVLRVRVVDTRRTFRTLNAKTLTFARFTTSLRQVELLSCLQEAFEKLGVSTELLVDNMKTAVDRHQLKDGDGPYADRAGETLCRTQITAGTEGLTPKLLSNRQRWDEAAALPSAQSLSRGCNTVGYGSVAREAEDGREPA